MRRFFLPYALLAWGWYPLVRSWEAPSWSFVSTTTIPRCAETQYRTCWAGFGKAVHYYDSSRTCRESCVFDASPERYQCGPCPSATQIVSMDSRPPPAAADAMKIRAFDEGMVIPDGLWLTRKVFGPEISAKGTSSLVVHKGFIFVTHYSGGMNGRFVGISRKRIATGAWKTIIFSHQHVMFRRDQELPEHERRGDSHNIIALGISPIDDSMHLLYDMHAYTPDDFANDYFNYQYTAPGAALVSDEYFTAALFRPKQTFLNPHVNRRAYYRITYPTFLVTDDQQLFVNWRKGGSTSAEIVFHRYEASSQSWSNPWFWNTQSSGTRSGIYGEFRQQQNRIYYVWQRRKTSDAQMGYRNNRGLYLAYTDSVDSIQGQWQSANDNVKVDLPIQDLEAFRLGDPSVPGESMVGGGGGATLPYAISPDGSFHALLRVDGQERHCYKRRLDSQLVISDNEVGWKSVGIYYVHNRIVRIGLEDGQPIIQSTEPGGDLWRDEYKAQSDLRFSHGVSTLVNGSTIYYYLMQRKPAESDQRPLYVLRFEVEAAF